MPRYIKILCILCTILRFCLIFSKKYVIISLSSKYERTDVKTFVVDCFRTNWVFVKVYTDEGITGVGEGTLP